MRRSHSSQRHMLSSSVQWKPSCRVVSCQMAPGRMNRGKIAPYLCNSGKLRELFSWHLILLASFLYYYQYDFHVLHIILQFYHHLFFRVTSYFRELLVNENNSKPVRNWVPSEPTGMLYPHRFFCRYFTRQSRKAPQFLEWKWNDTWSTVTLRSRPQGKLYPASGMRENRLARIQHTA